MSARVPAALALCLALLPGTAGAVVRVRLQVDPPNPAAGQVFRVVYGISAQNESRSFQATPLDLGTLQVLSRPMPPSTGDFVMFGGGGPGMQMSMDSNVEYLAIAPRAGRYTLRNAAIIDRATGQVVARQPALTVVVGAADPNAPQPQPQQPQFPGMPGFPGLPGFPEPQAPVAPTGPDVPPDGQLTGASFDPAGFIRVHVDNPNPYVGEPVTYRAWVYIPAYDAGCEPLQEPTVTGFWSENLERPSNLCANRWLPVSVNNQGMGAGMVRRLALYPTRAGELTIGALAMNVEFIVGDSFFGSRRRVRLNSPTLTLSAREAPPEGRPRDYIPGTLGPIALEASLDRERVTAGETATLSIRARGNGYIGSVALPPLREVDGLRVHPAGSRLVTAADTSALTATREDRFAIVPQRAGRFALGSYAVSYFDPRTQRYGEARVELPAIEVTGAAVTRDADADREDPAVALDPFDPGASLRPHRAVFTTAARVWGAVALPGVALALAAIVRALRGLRARRSAEDADRARNDPASLLDAAERAVTAGDLATALSHLGRSITLSRKVMDAPELSSVQAEADTLRFAGAAELSPEVLRGLIAKVRPHARPTEDA